MQLFISNASQLNYPQPDVEKSLGGYISSSLLRNNYINNIFSDLIIPNNNEETVECKAVFLRNTSGVIKSNVTLYYDYPHDPSDVKLEVAIVLPNSTGAIEKIPTSDSTPLYASFSELNGEDNKAVISSSLAIDGFIGIWLKRTYLTKRQKTDKQLYDEYIIYKAVLDKYEAGEELTEEEQEIYDNWNNKVDKINFIIGWD